MSKPDTAEYEYISLVQVGYSAAMNGNELWVATETDEPIKIVIKDHALRWGLYCKNLKITIETTSLKTIQQITNP